MRRLIGLFSIAACIFLHACGGGGANPAATGDVTLYITDDISAYKQVTATVTKVQLVRTGAAGSICDLLGAPVSIDLSNLSSVVQVLNVVSCPAFHYNRVHLEFDKGVILTDQHNAGSTCSFDSYKDLQNLVNALQCDKDTGVCSMDITGAVNVFANGNNNFALDFDLKNFDVSGLSSSDCTATMKVSPMNDSDIADRRSSGYKDGISGNISGLDTGARTFRIVKGLRTFTVNYSSALQQNVEQLLQFAADNGLAVKIESSNFNRNSNTFVASAVFVKTGGAISDLDTGRHTFALTYRTGGTISVDYTNAGVNNSVLGQLSDGIDVEVRLDGFTGTVYTAHEVKVGDTITED